MEMDFTGWLEIQVYVYGKQKTEKLRNFHCFLEHDFVWQHKNFEVSPCMTAIQKKSWILYEWVFSTARC